MAHARAGSRVCPASNYDPKTSGQSALTTIGTGPFKYKSYEPGVKVQLVRNPDYFIKDYRIWMASISRSSRCGRADDRPPRGAARHDRVSRIPAASGVAEGSEHLYSRGKGFYGARILFDLNLPPTNDVRVRRALNFAIDRKTIVDAVLAGEGAPIWGVSFPGRFGYAKELEVTTATIQEGRALLQERLDGLKGMGSSTTRTASS